MQRRDENDTMQIVNYDERNFSVIVSNNNENVRTSGI